MATRIYIVTGPTDLDRRLVRAPSPATALRHAARQTFEVGVASQEELVQLLLAGVPVEEPGAAEEQEAA